MKDILPIGTMISIDGRLLMIIGYNTQKGEESFIHYYGVVPYPLGFLDKESLFLLPMNSGFTVVRKGYDSDRFIKYIKNRQHLIETTSRMTVAEWEKISMEMDSLLKEVEDI